jgi:vacuolar-type H+-ATPase subunit I/STV1
VGRPNRRTPSRPSGGAPAGNMHNDVRAINSSVLLIGQKIKYIVRNEKILGRNLIVLNKKLKALEEKIVTPAEISGSGNSEDVSELKKKVELLEAQISDMQSRMVSQEEFKELRYIIDSINPLEFATLSQVKDLIEKNKE